MVSRILLRLRGCLAWRALRPKPAQKVYLPLDGRFPQKRQRFCETRCAVEEGLRQIRAAKKLFCESTHLFRLVRLALILLGGFWHRLMLGMEMLQAKFLQKT